MYRPLYVALIGGYAALIGGIVLGRALLGSALLPVVVIVLMVLYGSAISAAALWCERSRQELLAEVDHIARHLHDLALIPWWGPVEERRGRLLAMLAFFRAPGYNA